MELILRVVADVGLVVSIACFFCFLFSFLFVVVECVCVCVSAFFLYLDFYDDIRQCLSMNCCEIGNSWLYLY